MVLKSWKKVNNFSIFFTLVCIKQLEVAGITCYAGIYFVDALTVLFVLSALKIHFLFFFKKIISPRHLYPSRGH